MGSAHSSARAPCATSSELFESAQETLSGGVYGVWVPGEGPDAAAQGRRELVGALGLP